MSNPKYQDMRISGLEPGLAIKTTTSTDGAEIQHVKIDAGDGTTGEGVKAGGGDRGLSEFDFAANQVYNLRVTSRAASNKVLIRLNFYQDLGV